MSSTEHVVTENPTTEANNTTTETTAPIAVTAQASTLKEKKKEEQSPHLNPDPLCRLIGPANEALVLVGGMLKTALLDTGAQVSLITNVLCEELKLPIKELGGILNLTGPSGALIPYLGYVEVNIRIPKQEFDEDILMLVIEPNGYHERVPMCLGIQVLRSAMKKLEKREDMEDSWKNIRYSLTTANNAQNVVKTVTEASFPLEQVTGYVRTTKSVQIPAFSTAQISGLTTIRGHCGRINVLAEGIEDFSDEPKGYSTVTTYGTLHPGSNRLGVGVRNFSPDTVLIPARTKIAVVQAANKIPDMVCPKQLFDQDEESSEDTDEGSKEDSSNKSEEPEPEPGTYAWLKTKCDLSGMFHWKKEDQKLADECFEDYIDLFSVGELDLGKTKLTEHRINLDDDKPFKERYRTIPSHMYDEVRQHLSEMLEIGAIVPSCSPWSSAVVLARRKDGQLRFCIDFRKLNKRTIKDSYALPRVEDTLNALKDAIIFSMLDQKSGYWQVPVAEKDKELTAFTVGPLGFYQCERMPFGLTNAPATFQRLMENCLGDLNLNWCLIYLDDLIVFSHTPKEHIQRLRAVFERLRNAGLKLKPKKCFFFSTEVDYLGHVVSKAGIATNPKKTDAVKEWPIPVTVTDVRKFLGFVGYYRRFIPRFSIIARPLHHLISGEEAKKKTHVVPWDTDCQAAFNKLRDLCVNTPVLAYAHYDEPFFLSTDASIEGLGAVLYQKREGNLKPIAYASRSLNNAERNYTSHKLEFLALKWAVTEKFHEYLYGAKETVTVYTDNNPLTYILTSAKLDATGHRWVADLANYNFNILYRPGKDNKDADALSRRPWYHEEEEVKKATMIDAPILSATLQGTMCPTAGYIEQMVGSVQALDDISDEPHGEIGCEIDDWSSAQREDIILREVVDQVEDQTFKNRIVRDQDEPEMKLLIKQKSALHLREKVLYRRTRLQKSAESRFQVVVPKKFRQKALEGTHDLVGHLGFERMISLMRDRFYWPAMDADAKRHIERCDRCRKFKMIPHKAPMENIKASYPLELIHIDFLGIEDPKDSNKKKDILMVTDHFTRYAQAYVTTSQTAVTTAKTLWEKYFVHYGFPEYILSDQGANFESKVIRELCLLAGVKKIRTTPYHPQTNGQCERFNRTLISMLGTLDVEKKRAWPSHVSTLVHAYNCTRNSSTGYSPYFLLYGRHPRLPIDVAFGLRRGSPGPFSAQSEYVKQLNIRMQWAFRKAAAQMEKEATRAKKRYDLKTRGVSLKSGDAVLIRKVKFDGKHKIQDKWEDDPYIVLGRKNSELPVYKVRSTTTPRIRVLHRNMLLPLPTTSEDYAADAKNFGDKVSFSVGEEDEDKGIPRAPSETQKTGIQTHLDPKAPSFIPQKDKQMNKKSGKISDSLLVNPGTDTKSSILPSVILGVKTKSLPISDISEVSRNISILPTSDILVKTKYLPKEEKSKKEEKFEKEEKSEKVEKSEVSLCEKEESRKEESEKEDSASMESKVVEKESCSENTSDEKSQAKKSQESLMSSENNKDQHSSVTPHSIIDGNSTQGEYGSNSEDEDSTKDSSSSQSSGSEEFSLAPESIELSGEVEDGSSSDKSNFKDTVSGSPDEEQSDSESEEKSESSKEKKRPRRVRKQPDRFGYTKMGGTNQMVEVCSLAVRTVLSVVGIKKDKDSSRDSKRKPKK